MIKLVAIQLENQLLPDNYLKPKYYMIDHKMIFGIVKVISTVTNRKIRLTLPENENTDVTKISGKYIMPERESETFAENPSRAVLNQ